MILTMIIAIAVAVLLAVFIGKNLAYSTSLWLFKDFGETNVAVIVLIAFAAGIVFALLCILLGKIAKETRDAEKAKAVKESKEEKDSKPAKEPKASKESKKALAAKEAEAPKAVDAAASSTANTSEPAKASGEKNSPFSKLFSMLDGKDDKKLVLKDKTETDGKAEKTGTSGTNEDKNV